MGLKALKSRIERLERRMNGGECDGCNAIGIDRFFFNLERRHEGEPDIEDWSKTDLARCPDCGNPNPKASRRCWTEGLAKIADKPDQEESNKLEQDKASEIDRDVK